MNVEKISDKIEFLEKLILHIDSDVKFEMALQWTILGVAIAALGVVLVIIAKKWFNDALEKEFKNFKTSIVNDVVNHKVINALRDASLEGIQTIISPTKVHSAIITCYIPKESELSYWTIAKGTLMYSLEGKSQSNIKLISRDGSSVELKVKGINENSIQFEWTKSGNVEHLLIGLEIMVF